MSIEDIFYAHYMFRIHCRMKGIETAYSMLRKRMGKQ